jgi:hypothetical protein
MQYRSGTSILQVHLYGQIGNAVGQLAAANSLIEEPGHMSLILASSAS